MNVVSIKLGLIGLRHCRELLFRGFGYDEPYNVLNNGKCFIFGDHA